MTHPARRLAPIAAVPGDALVLARRPLHPDERLKETSRYADDVWGLTPAWLRADRKPLKIDFTTLPPVFIDTAKRLFYALLTEDTPPGEEPITIGSIRNYFGGVRRFLLWAYAHGRTLAEVTGDDLDLYHGELVGLRLSLSSILRHRRGVRMLWAYRSRLVDHLSQDPLRRPLWHAWVRANPRVRGENLTDRIPEHVLGPLLTWALRWVDDFADDVLAAGAERDRIDTHRPATADPLEVLQILLDGFRRRGQPLPAAPAWLAPGRGSAEVFPNIPYLARLAGYPLHRFSKGRPRRLIAEAARELGVDSDTPLTHTVRARLDGRPWLERISYYDVARFERLLVVSCYVVIAYLSGMRDCEIKHLRRGCISVQCDPDGHVYRRRLHSLAFKGEDAHGAAATWIVTAPVQRAVAVLERLQPSEQPHLFTPPASSPTWRQPSPHHVVRSGSTNKGIKALMEWINAYCAATGRPDAIPEHKGRLPHLTTRQFRRTLAWFIARRPGGSIAGALQYRHQRIQMFEGYANPRELHQTGEKSQVASSRRGPDRLRGYYDLAA